MDFIASHQAAAERVAAPGPRASSSGSARARKSVMRDALVEVEVPGGRPVTTACGKHRPFPDLHREPNRVRSLLVANEQVHLGDLISRFREATNVGLR